VTPEFSQLTPLTRIMAEAATKAGRQALRDFGNRPALKVTRKGPTDFVTSADLKAEKTIRQTLGKYYPDYGLVQEEGGIVEGTHPTRRWVVDPIDGTNNYLRGLPYFCISIGLEEQQANGTAEPIAGVVYAPATDELFWAERTHGAYCNNRRLRISECHRLEEAMAVVSSRTIFRQPAAHPLDGIASMRCFGASALDLAYFAAGRIEVLVHRGLSSWDMAGGIVIALEAGAQIAQKRTLADCYASGEFCITTESLLPKLQKLLNHAA
jgi:myo-inositol-1(or 4)-monophosphatase